MIGMILSLLFLHPVIEEAIPEGTFIYPGKGPREIILVDPDHSPQLEQAYEGLISKLDVSLTEYQILQILFQYIRYELFDLTLCNDREVGKLIYTLHPNQEEPEISLERFLESKTGVCRHTALTATYLMNRLIQAGWLEGETFLIRANCRIGRHAWTLFLSDEGAWHLDCLWAILENGKTSAGFSKLCQKYGKRTMDEQKARWEKETITSKAQTKKSKKNY